jgi:hypothetical protein
MSLRFEQWRLFEHETDSESTLAAVKIVRITAVEFARGKCGTYHRDGPLTTIRPAKEGLCIAYPSDSRPILDPTTFKMKRHCTESQRPARNGKAEEDQTDFGREFVINMWQVPGSFLWL